MPWRLPKGANLAGSRLFEDTYQADIYASIMTRARRTDVVLARLGANPGTAFAGQAMGKIVNETYTPEEKARFEQALISRSAGMGLAARDATLMPPAEAAGLVDLESRWRLDSMGSQSIDQQLVTLQSQRGLYGDLGRQLEDHAARNPGRPAEAAALAQAIQAFIADGDIDSQVRVMRKALARNALSGALLDRYLTLMASMQPAELLAVARGNGSAEIRNRAVQFAILGDRSELAYSAIQARGSALASVWTKAYTALTGQYFDDRSPAIDAAFQGALDTRTIGERLRTPLKPDSVIVGTVWFYYGERYGEYLGSGKNVAADAWLPASLEADSGDPDAYVALGDWYAESGQGAKAIVQFEHALELDPDRGDAHDRIARVLWSEDRRPEAIARWKSALAVFLRIQSAGVRVPEPFWSRVAQTFIAIGDRHALGELRGEIANLLGDYYQRNNVYRLNELIEPAARASIVSGEGTAWLVELSRSMSNAWMVLNALTRVSGLTDAQKIALQRDEVADLSERAEASFGDAREYSVSQATQARLQLISMLLDAGDVTGATAEWSQIPAARSPWEGDQYRDEVEIRLAAKTGSLDSLLARYRAQPDSAPSVNRLQSAAIELRREGDENAGRSVLEFLYDREIRAGHLEAANFLGLAEVKLQRNDTAAAVTLLNRMPLVIEDGFDTLLPAAALLEKYGKTAEAADFLRKRVRAVPWDSEAKTQLARTISSGSAERDQLLSAAVSDTQAAYSVRAEAARLAIPRPMAGVSGTELALLSAPAIAPDAAAKPFQVEARIDAARQATSSEVKARLLLEALAIAPTDERVRLGALRATLALRRDSLALAIAGTPGRLGSGDEESLVDAAERLDDLNAARVHLRTAIGLRSTGDPRREALVRRLDALVAEQNRRSKNAARQPAIKDIVEQDRVVRPRINRSLP